MKNYFFFIVPVLTSCVGEDVIDDAVEPKVVITNPINSIQVGEGYTFTFNFFDNVGMDTIPDFIEWTSSNDTIATIDEKGTLMTLNAGMVDITVEAQLQELMATTQFALRILGRKPRITITNPRVSLPIMTSSPHQFEFAFFDDVGQEVTPTSIMWSSSDENILTITSDDGTVTPLDTGTANIRLQTGIRDLQVDTTFSLQIVGETVRPQVMIAPILSSLPLGISRSFSFMFFNNRGEPESPTSVMWSSSDENVLTIDQDGRVTSVSEGTATINLQVGIRNLMASTTLSLQVVVPLVDPEVIITNPCTSLTVGTPPHQFEFTFLNNRGEESTPTSVIWSSSDESILTIAEDGMVTPVSEGMATITLEVSLGDVMASTTLSLQVVLPLVEPVVMITNELTRLTVGTPHQFGFTFLDDRGEEEDPTSVIWSSSNENILTIAQDGTATPVSDGMATITLAVSLGDLMASTTLSLQVSPDLIDPVVMINNPRDSLSEDMSYQFEFTFFNDMGEKADPTSVMWSSSNKNILTIDADSGTVTPVSEGSATITLAVSSGNLMADTTLSLQVVRPLVDPEVIITNPRTRLTVGMPHQFRFTFCNDRGEEATPSSIIWSSPNGSVLTIAQDGTATPVSAGMTTITLEVSLGDLMATITLSLQVVRPLVEPVVMITNPRTSLCVGMSYPPFGFTFFDDRGDEETPTSVTWSSSDTNVLTIAQDGTATPVFSGMATITLEVSLGDLMATTTLSIQVVSPLIDPVVMITNPPGTSLVVGRSYPPFEFEFFDDMGNTATPTSVTWSSSDANVLTIAQDGTVTPVSGGMAMITLRVELRDLTADTTINVVVAAPSTRSGSIARSSYTISGDFTLTKQGNGIVIRLESNYLSTGIPGLVLYLSNGPNQSPPNGVRRVASIDSRGSTRATGPLEFTVDNVGLFDYSYLLFWCEPFNIKIAHGQITN